MIHISDCCAQMYKLLSQVCRGFATVVPPYTVDGWVVGILELWVSSKHASSWHPSPWPSFREGSCLVRHDCHTRLIRALVHMSACLFLVFTCHDLLYTHSTKHDYFPTQNDQHFLIQTIVMILWGERRIYIYTYIYHVFLCLPLPSGKAICFLIIARCIITVPHSLICARPHCHLMRGAHVSKFPVGYLHREAYITS